jgi:formate hydrogenlyase subunit 6/NADH:ubiquinone oxidoreductase subunit I
MGPPAAENNRGALMTALQAYFSNIYNSVTSIFEGMAVTMSWMFRRPITIQYPHTPSAPDTKVGGPESLPERYRGFLEVDLDMCSACMQCMKTCPIDCIQVEVEKVPPPDDPEGKPVRMLTRFDIDMSKCMYCGLCSEPCPTKAIHHTRHFEAPVANIEHLYIRFVKPGTQIPLAKVKKGEVSDPANYGKVAERLYVERPWDQGPIQFTESTPSASSDEK